MSSDIRKHIDLIESLNRDDYDESNELPQGILDILLSYQESFKMPTEELWRKLMMSYYEISEQELENWINEDEVSFDANNDWIFRGDGNYADQDKNNGWKSIETIPDQEVVDAIGHNPEDFLSAAEDEYDMQQDPYGYHGVSRRDFY